MWSSWIQGSFGLTFTGSGSDPWEIYGSMLIFEYLLTIFKYIFFLQIFYKLLILVHVYCWKVRCIKILRCILDQDQDLKSRFGSEIKKTGDSDPTKNKDSDPQTGFNQPPIWGLIFQFFWYEVYPPPPPPAYFEYWKTIFYIIENIKHNLDVTCYLNLMVFGLEGRGILSHSKFQFNKVFL